MTMTVREFNKDVAAKAAKNLPEKNDRKITEMVKKDKEKLKQKGKKTNRTKKTKKDAKAFYVEVDSDSNLSSSPVKKANDFACEEEEIDQLLGNIKFYFITCTYSKLK